MKREKEKKEGGGKGEGGEGGGEGGEREREGPKTFIHELFQGILFLDIVYKLFLRHFLKRF